MLVVFVDWRICWIGTDLRVGETVIPILVIVLVKRNDQKTIVSLRPLIVAIKVLPKPGIADETIVTDVFEPRK